MNVCLPWMEVMVRIGRREESRMEELESIRISGICLIEGKSSAIVLRAVRGACDVID